MTTAAARGDARGWPEPGGIAMGAAGSSTSSRREEAHEARAKTKEEDIWRPTTDFALVAGGRRRSAGAMRVCVCVAALGGREGEGECRSGGLGLRGRGWALGHGGEEAAEKDGPAWEAGWALSLSSFFSLFPQPEL